FPMRQIPASRIAGPKVRPLPVGFGLEAVSGLERRNLGVIVESGFAKPGPRSLSGAGVGRQSALWNFVHLPSLGRFDQPLLSARRGFERYGQAFQPSENHVVAPGQRNGIQPQIAKTPEYR